MSVCFSCKRHGKCLKLAEGFTGDWFRKSNIQCACNEGYTAERKKAVLTVKGKPPVLEKGGTQGPYVEYDPVKKEMVERAIEPKSKPCNCTRKRVGVGNAK